MTWQDVYKLPLKQDDYCPFIVWTVDKVRAFDFLTKKYNQQHVIGIINGVIDRKENDYFSYADGLVSYNSVPLLRIRGWGHLTGVGGLHLSNEEAIKIQDEFGEYITNKLNGKS